jgi:hypothetical protein
MLVRDPQKTERRVSHRTGVIITQGLLCYCQMEFMNGEAERGRKKEFYNNKLACWMIADPCLSMTILP